MLTTYGNYFEKNLFLKCLFACIFNITFALRGNVSVSRKNVRKTTIWLSAEAPTEQTLIPILFLCEAFYFPEAPA